MKISVADKIQRHALKHVVKVFLKQRERDDIKRRGRFVVGDEVRKRRVVVFTDGRVQRFYVQINIAQLEKIPYLLGSRFHFGGDELKSLSNFDTLNLKLAVDFVDKFNLKVVLNRVTDLILLLARQEAENFIEVVVSELVARDIRANLLGNVLRVHVSSRDFFEQSRAPAHYVVESRCESVFVPRDVFVEEHLDFAVGVAADNRLDLFDVAGVHADD